MYAPCGKFNRKKWKAIKAISKEELNILIKSGSIVRSSNGYIDPETHFVVGYYRTKGGAGRVYIEDMYADKAKKLYLKGLIWYGKDHWNNKRWYKSIFIGQIVGWLESYKWYFSYH